MNFNSHADRVVLLAAALVNVVTPGERCGRPYAVPTAAELTTALGGALGRPAREWERPAHQRGAATLGGEARGVFQAVEDGDVDGAARRVNAMLGRYRPVPELDHHDGEPWHLHYHGAADRDATGWGGGVSVALAAVVGSEEADRLGVCSAPHCDRVFVDVSRNGTRRFCSTACQNRVKAAAHRARSAAG